MKEIRSVRVAKCWQCGAGLAFGASVRPAQDDDRKPVCLSCLVRDNYEATHKLSYDGSMIRKGGQSDEN